MKRAWLVAKKDIQIFFNSPLAYVIMALTVFIMSLFFDRIIDIHQRMSQGGHMGMRGGQFTLNFAMERFYYNVLVVFMFMIPGLTMRSFCSEKKENTLELLVTSPLRLWELVLGKFIGVGAFWGGLLLANFIFAAYAMAFGTNLDLKLLLSIHIGLFLMGLAFSAIGLFASSLTSNQVIAYLVAFTLILSFFLLGSFQQAFSGVVLKFVEQINLVMKYQDFTKGMIKSSNIVFFASFFFFWLFLTFRVIESQNWRS